MQMGNMVVLTFGKRFFWSDFFSFWHFFKLKDKIFSRGQALFFLFIFTFFVDKILVINVL